ncbi:hypothetical protein A4A49_52360 [Nicotiana attenuata]|uniref:Uncharacterized protein n=1 Tax=Nicotiana attenuata TaxID=49451 RepID=A0A1J6J2U0_NICAT|nr:hypothetical protein A4A49_52360 [Nicotiana attenuata]
MDVENQPVTMVESYMIDAPRGYAIGESSSASGSQPYLSKLLVDDEPKIRENTIVLLANIAHYLNKGTRNGVLIDAFADHALHDTSSCARKAGFRALIATSSYYDMTEIMSRILPKLIVLMYDADRDVGSKAFEAHYDKDTDPEAKKEIVPGDRQQLTCPKLKVNDQPVNQQTILKLKLKATDQPPNDQTSIDVREGPLAVEEAPVQPNQTFQGPFHKQRDNFVD